MVSMELHPMQLVILLFIAFIHYLFFYDAAVLDVSHW